MSDRAGRKQPSGHGLARGRHHHRVGQGRGYGSGSHYPSEQRSSDHYRPEPAQLYTDIAARSRDQPSRPHSPAQRDEQHRVEHPAGRLQRLLVAKRNIELQIVNTEIDHELQQLEMERDARNSRRYDDGEVTRYGAGESYRPFNDRTPRRAKSPERERRSPQPRERVRSPPLEPRELRDRPRSPPREPRERPRSPPREPREPRSPPREPRERPRSPPREPRERLRSPPREPRERPRSPPRGPRARSPLLRERARSPPMHDNRYIPDRTPRRRSRSPFRPDRSRDRARDDDRGPAAADTWRRRERTRSPIRRPSPRRSPVRRNSPPPRRFSPMRRDIRDDRDRRNFNQRDPRSFPPSFSFQPETIATFGGRGDSNPNNMPVAQSKRITQNSHVHAHNMSSSDYHREESRRHFDAPATAHWDPDQRQDPASSAAPNMTSKAYYAPRSLHSNRDPHYDSGFNIPSSLIDMPIRVRSRSGDRDRRDVRDRDRRSPPPRRISPPGVRNGPFRRRSPSMDRRDDRFIPMQRRPSPPRKSAISSTYPSRDQSRRQSPAPLNGRRDDRSNPQSPGSSRPQSRSPQRPPPRERSPVRSAAQAPARSPPRGPAAARPPPTGPRGDRAWRDTRDDRDSRNFSARSAPVVNDTPNRPVPAPSRQDAVSPSVPPAGPRGYGSTRGGYGRGGGRGNTWNASVQSRNLSPAPGPAPISASNNSISVPTGPRGHTPSATSVPSTPTIQPKPFNPPKGPAAEKRQLSVFEKEVATMTPIIPGGQMSVEDEAAMKGVLPEQLVHFKAAEEEADRFRKEIEKNEEKTRAMMADFRKGKRECEILKLRSDLTEAAVARSSGDSFTGSAF